MSFAGEFNEYINTTKEYLILGLPFIGTVSLEIFTTFLKSTLFLHKTEITAIPSCTVILNIKLIVFFKEYFLNYVYNHAVTFSMFFFLTWG